MARSAGLDVDYRPNTMAGRLGSALRSGYAMFHMDDPSHARALTMRRVYHYPFWQIESSARRWDWHVTKTAFDPADVDPEEAGRFPAFWRKRLFPSAPPVGAGGFVYVPLQGRLTEHRSFQTASPLAMIEAVLQHDPGRPVIATLHPNEIYTEAEKQALSRLAAQHPRLTVETGGMETRLPACDYVVTQNSSVAFNGIFFDKPMILFAQVDFHHIAANVRDLGVAAAFDAVWDMRPDYAAYLWWFWQKMSINAGRPEAHERIREAMLRAGWLV